MIENYSMLYQLVKSKKYLYEDCQGSKTVGKTYVLWFLLLL